MAATEPEAKPTESTEAPKKKGRLMPMMLVGGLMAAEGAGVFFVTKMFFGAEPAEAAAGEHDAAPAHGESGGHDEHGDKPSAHGAPVSTQAEVELTECKPSNRVSGKLITLRIRVSALVASADVERGKQLVEANKARINDRVNVVIRSAEPSDLNEPGLETIKRRLKHELARVLGDEKLIQEILIPEMLQSGSGL